MNDKKKAAEHLKNGRFREARKIYTNICKSTYADSEAWGTLGAINIQLASFNEAIICLEKSLTLKPDAVLIQYNLGQAYMHMYRYKEAVEAYRSVLRRKRNDFIAYNNLGFALNYLGKTDEAIDALQSAIRVKPNYTSAHSFLLYVLNNLDTCTPEYLYDQHKRWETLQVQHPISVSDHKNLTDVEKVLRVGYISPDFRRHSVNCFFEPLLELHNPEAVTTYCYANVQNPDEITTRLQSKADYWRDISRLSDADVVSLVLADNIDILVDMAGHTIGNRLRVFAHKPAPVQITYLGYPATTGLSAMDYRVTDSWVEPPGKTEKYSSETLLRIPHGHHCYRPLENAPAIATPPEIDNGFITFGSFNSLSKTNKTILRHWAEILRKVPDSRLIIKDRPFVNQDTRDYFIGLFEAHGVSSDRIGLYDALRSNEDHLGFYGKLDIALDTFPYNGVTTTCEALWMGVPVVTLSGMTSASRFGESLLRQVGMPDLIAHSVESYIQLAIALAKSKELRYELRDGLREKMSKSWLRDEKCFVRSMENAYRQVWGQWCSNKHKVKTC